jgi:hypothetical protein
MKKTIIILCVCLVALAGLSADGFSDRLGFLVRATPYALQSVSTTKGSFLSRYGFGFGAGLRYDLTKNIVTGIDLDGAFYNYNELQNQYMVFGVRSIIGYRHEFNEKFYAEGEIGLGASMKMIGGGRAFTFSSHAYAGSGYRFTPKISMTAGVDLGLAFQKRDPDRSTDFEVKIALGAKYEL